MDGVSIAASIIGIAAAGAQVSFKLVTLATRISTASDRVSAIGNDISLTSNVLHQLVDLMPEKTGDAGISILSPEAIETTKTAAAMCEKIFSKMEKEVQRASAQLRRYKPGLGKMRAPKIELSMIERAKWPFLQPRIDGLRTDLRDAKSTLMLLLEVANLALNKRRADAPESATELQDSIRAIVALEIERREGRTNPIEPPEVPSSSGSIKSTDSEILNMTSPRRKTSSSENIQSRGLPPGDGSNFSVARSPGLNDQPTVEHAPSEPGNKIQSTHNLGLQLFLLKPQVEDHYDRIELRWTVQDTKMQPLAIREYMNKNEKDEIPTVVEMLQHLHAYEQEMVESETPKDSGKSILSLKRTTTDLQTRDMLFKAVPGLQFVVQRHVGLSLTQGEGLLRQTIHRVSGLVDLLRHRVSGLVDLLRHRVSGHQNSLRAQSKASKSRYFGFSSSSSTRRMEVEFDGEFEHEFQACLPSGSATSLAVESMGAQREYDGQYFELDSAGAVPDEEAEAEVDEEAEAEAMVNDLLKQYTTLFDS